MPIKKLIPFFWLIYRLVLINALIFLTALLIGTFKNLFEPIEPFMVRFPFRIYMVALFLTNLIYLIGNGFETLYLRLWNKKIRLRTFESKFFNAGIMMMIIVYTFGIISYLIDLFA